MEPLTWRDTLTELVMTAVYWAVRIHHILFDGSPPPSARTRTLGESVLTDAHPISSPASLNDDPISLHAAVGMAAR